MPYQLVCMDIDMPCANGHEAIQSIRAIEADRNVPPTASAKIVMLTAMDHARHCFSAFAEGCDAYLFKPLDPDRLLDTIASLSSARSPSE